MERAARLAKARVAAYARTSADKLAAANALSDRKTKESLRMVIKPPKVSSSLRKAGIALLLTPDPLTAVPGIAALGASVVMKKREPASIADLARETSLRMDELRALLEDTNYS